MELNNILDGSNAGQPKLVFVENPDYDYKEVSAETTKILPVNVSTESKQILSHLYLMINEGYLAIPEKYEKLIISLRTTQAMSIYFIKNRLVIRIV